MIFVSARLSHTRIRFAFVAALVALFLAGCGQDETSREFAPEIRDEQVLETSTPAATSTTLPINRQPGETGSEPVDSAELIGQEGPAVAVGFGLGELTILSVVDGERESTGVPRDSDTTSAVAPDGSMILTVERSDGSVRLVSRDASGKELASWQPNADASPEASPAPEVRGQGIDRIVWDPQSASAFVSIGGVGHYVADHELNLTPIAPDSVASVTAVAWAPTGQTIALASWDAERRAAIIRTVSLQDLTRLTTVLELAGGDGRFVRSMAWGNERVGLVFALRSSGSGFSLPSDLYHLPRFGQPMRLLATAGAAAPAAVVDQIAIAGNGSTVAYTVLIPGEVGFRYHSLWITDAEAEESDRIETPSIRRVSDLVWTSKGLSVVGTRRESENGQSFQSAVVELVTTDGLTSIGAVRSDATPVGSPGAPPDQATPES